MKSFTLSILLLLLAAATLPAADVPTIQWRERFASIESTGVEYSERLRELDGKRVRIRGHAVRNPPLEGGLYVTRFEHQDPHGVEEKDLPWDAIAVIWRSDLEIPNVPRRPTIEGTLRLGNRPAGEQIVMIVLEDAEPVVARSEGE